MEVQFAKWGNSVGLRVPAKVAEELGIAPGSMADLEIRKDRLVITPRSHAYRLDDLLAGITPDNVHREISTGKSVGGEVCD
jgi:antitoxin MazE